MPDNKRGFEHERHTAGGAASAMMEKGKEVAERASEAASQAKGKVQEWAGTAAEKAGQARESVGEGIENLGGRLRRNAPQEGMLGQAASAVADQVEAVGSYIKDHGLKDMGEDVTGLIRRYPLPALLISLGLGFLIARATQRS